VTSLHYSETASVRSARAESWSPLASMYVQLIHDDVLELGLDICAIQTVSETTAAAALSQVRSRLTV